jgi:transposase InsO family protein
MGFFRKKKKKSSRAKGKARSTESGVTRAPAPPERPQVPAEPATELRVSAPRKSASPKARVNAPMEVKLLAIEAWEAGLTAREVAELTGVSTATVSAWRKLHRDGGVAALSRKPTSPSARRICRQLEERITAQRKAHPERGVRRIRDDLRQEQAVEVSAETVRRVVNDAGLGNPAPRSKRRPPQIRRFERALPNAMWQIDIFTFQLKRHYPVYLIGLIDDHSRYIVGWGLFRQQKADAVLEVLKGAIGEWGAPRELLSDNGRQFVAWRGKSRFQKVLTRQGVQHVRSAPHHPMTLGKIERFWKTIWDEFLEEAAFASFADATQRIGHWIAYYGHQRPHQGIGGACPADRFFGVAGDKEESLRQGCQENALRLALGQEPRPPLYLLGKLGDTDVRVTRNGEDLEIKIGDAIHEVIRLGAPYEATDKGLTRRQEATDEVDAAQRRGTVPGGGTGAVGAGGPQGAVPDVWSEPPDLESGHPARGRGVGVSAGAQEGGATGQELGAGGAHRAQTGLPEAGEEAQGGRATLRGSQSLPGAGAEAGSRRAAAWREGSGGEKKMGTEETQTQKPQEPLDYARLWSNWDSTGDGVDE